MSEQGIASPAANQEAATALEATPRIDSELAVAVQMSRKAPTRLSTTDIKAILELSTRGYTQVQIAEIVECSQATVSNTLRDFNRSPAVIRMLANGLSEESIDAWRTAMHKAADRGDHRPARELIEMANPELRPQPANSAGGGGVTVVVMQQGAVRPEDLPVIEVSQAKASFRPSLSPLTLGESPTVSD
jgi:hypothetical protein